MPLIIKGKLIDKTEPVICVPIVEKTHEDIMSQARRLVVKHVDMVEWRADFYEDLMDPEALKTTLKGLGGIFSQTVLLVTVRTLSEGGEVDLDDEAYGRLLRQIAFSQCADLVDVEYFSIPDPSGLISQIQEAGCSVIASHHDFEKTPTRGVMVRIMQEMEKADPDIIKLCVMPKSRPDVAALIGALGEFSATGPSAELMAIAMGELGRITRIAPLAFGCAVTFASIDKASAPGQISYDRLKEAMALIKG